MKITLRNTFHRVEIKLMVGDPNRYGEYELSAHQVRRARRALCGVTECRCGGIGSWDPVYSVTEAQNQYGTLTGATVRPLDDPNSSCTDYYNAHGGWASVRQER